MKGVPAEAYEIAALALRYWFAILGVIIVWRSFSWLIKDRRYRKKRLKQLPDAGMVGELVVISGSEELPPGIIIPMPREGTIGRARICDVYLPAPGIASRQGDFRFKNGLGLIVMPAPRKKIHIDGKDYGHKDEDALMHHGSKMIIGQVVLRLRLFVGLETSKSAEEVDPLPAQLGAYVQDYYEQTPVGAGIDDASWEEEWAFSTQPYKRIPRQWDEEEPYDIEQAPAEEEEALFSMPADSEELTAEDNGSVNRLQTAQRGFELNQALYPAQEDEGEKEPQANEKKTFFRRKRKQ